LLKDCVAEAGRAGAAEKYSRQKLDELLGFFEQTTAWYEQVRRLPTSAMVKFIRLGGQLRKMLGS
jgi:hypothetical protein